ncbi:opioid growth factor receptor conserved region-domain-containing protein [Rhexocercosporidium sp. MPI-PUGE-AT-0058]|nr:opioid growth factor receptor conserved region-domain-containing protein [Rhexocercosporidium sp. MPI-PUGE-AT-0058]
MSLLITFYEGTNPDHRGRYLTDILGWNANKLESAHDYIQIVFPLPEESGVQWSAPTIDRQVFDAFRARPELRDRLKDSFKKILWFYGFELVDGEDGVKVRKGPNYDIHSGHWDVRFDHNHLRITRIIRCLRVLGLESEAQAFYAALQQYHRRVSSRSQEYWRRAAERTLNLRPDLDDNDVYSDDDLSIGPKFLREFEELRKHVEDSRKTDDGVDATKAMEVDGDRAEEGSGVKKVETKEGDEAEAGVKTTNDIESIVKCAEIGVPKLDMPDPDPTSKGEDKLNTAD